MNYDHESGQELLPEPHNQYPRSWISLGRRLLKLQHINPYPLATILVKIEFLNPGGSIKDRIAPYY